ncbi:MAG: cytochrome c [Acidobacteria bacterium]|nr:cytochrome c [Acidobacteriota bacterium]
MFAAITALAVPSPAPAAMAQGKKADPTKDLYVSNCQMCHGPDGVSPIKDMSFVGRQWKTTTTAEAVKVITNGVPGTVMLPFENKLKKEQITALARYVRALDTPQARKKK